MRYQVEISIEYNNGDKLLCTESFETKGDGKKVLKANLRRIYEKAYKEYYNDLSNNKIKDICLYGLKRIESIDINRLFLFKEFDKISKNINVPFINHINYETNRTNRKIK